MPEKSESVNLDILTNASGVGPSTLTDFEDAGFTTANEVGELTPGELSNRVNGVGYATAINVLKFLEKQNLRQQDTQDEELEQLIALLRELFEFDKDDRDFGVYKLMNEKRDTIDKFISEELVETIESEVSTLQEEFAGETEEEAERAVIDEMGSAAFDANRNLTTEAEQRVSERITGLDGVEAENIRSDIYNHIYQFFNNYYQNGDFITRRKRSHHDEPYSIPYDGSNTNFHWVTKDQYYAKTSEHFNRFSFNLEQLQFKFQTQNGELDGNGIGNSEYFVMEQPKHIGIEDDTVSIQFTRRMIDEDDLERADMSTSGRNKQQKLNTVFAEEITTALLNYGREIDTEKIETKLNEYTARNQNDFFIHKDIDGFLTGELEEYVKTEVVTFDPKSGFEGLSELKMEKGRIINEIATDIIQFVSQIEEFKKKLFEKKKFVTDRKELHQVTEIPEEHYETILGNEAQLDEWGESYSIDVDSLDVDVLSQEPYNQMVVDTSHFEVDVTTGEEPQNKLIRGDNYQALNFLQEKYQEGVKCIYIDPPYNTGNANFAYKDKYQRATWLSMMYDRLEKSKGILKDDGIIFISIDQHENHNLKNMANEIFGEENLLQELVWDLNTGFNRGHFKRSHEYILVYCKDKKELSHFNLSDSISTLRDFDSKYIIHNAVKSVDKNGRFSKISFSEGDIEYKGGDAVFEKGTNIGSKREPLTVVGNDAVFENGILKNRTEFEANWSMRNQLLDWLENGVTYDSKGQKVERFFIPKSGGMKYKKVRDGINPKSVMKGFPSGGRDEIENIFGYASYDYPKPAILVKELLALVTEENDIVLDFFAGSGTTAQAVQKLNRERDEQVNYIIVEMLEKAFNITEERVKRTAFTDDWEDGEPNIGVDDIQQTTLGDEESNRGLEFSAEVLDLESYEQALDAIRFDDSQNTLDQYNDYILNYLLEFGTNDSPVMLDTDQLDEPLEYNIKGSADAYDIDVMTTFNYLLGLDNITTTRQEIAGVEYTIYHGEKNYDDVCVVWRHDASRVDYDTEKEELSMLDYDTVYVNGDSKIDGSIPIGTAFSNKMFQDGDEL